MDKRNERNTEHTDMRPDLADYVCAFSKGGEIVIDSVIQKVGYYDAYVRALEKLEDKSV